MNGESRTPTCSPVRSVLPPAYGADEQKYLTADQLAGRVGVSLATVRKWRTRGQGPAAYKFCGVLRYKLDDVEKWEESCRERTIRGTRARVEWPRAVFPAR